MGIALRKNTLHFFLCGHTHLKVELPDALEVPEERYGLVDVYGSCTGISNARLGNFKDLQKEVQSCIAVSVSEQKLRECGIIHEKHEEETVLPRCKYPVTPRGCEMPVETKSCSEDQSSYHGRASPEASKGVMEPDTLNKHETAFDDTGGPFEDSFQEYDIPRYDDDEYLVGYHGSSQEGEGQWGVERRGLGGVVSAEGTSEEDHEVDTTQECWYREGSHQHRQEVEEEVGGERPVWGAGQHQHRQEVGGQRPQPLAAEDYNVVMEINNELIPVGTNKHVEFEVGVAISKTLTKNVKKADHKCSYSKLVYRYASTHDFHKKLEGKKFLNSHFDLVLNFSTFRGHAGYVDDKYDKCYCDGCSRSRGDLEVKPQGRPAQLYSMPRGWFKLGLK